MTGALEQGRQGAHVVGAEDDVHPWCPRDDRVLVLLSHTAADGQLHTGVSRLHRGHVAEGAVETIVGVLPDCTGVEDDDVSRRQGVGSGIGNVAGLLEETGNALGVMDIHLASVGHDPVGRGLGLPHGVTGHGANTLRHQPTYRTSPSLTPSSAGPGGSRHTPGRTRPMATRTSASAST